MNSLLQYLGDGFIKLQTVAYGNRVNPVESEDGYRKIRGSRHSPDAMAGCVHVRL